MESELEGRPTGELKALLAESAESQRIQIRLELADRCLRAGDWDDAAQHFRTAGEEALTMGDDSTAGEVFTRLGAARFHAREWEDSAAAYRRSAECFAVAGRSWQRAHALWGAGDAFMELGRFTDCLTATDVLGADIDTVGGPPDLPGRIALQRAHALYALERPDESLAEATRARDAFRRRGLAAQVARADDLALSICLAQGELDRALELATNCYVIALATTDDIDEAAAELRLAETHLERDEPEDALRYAEQARERFAAADDTAGIARADRLRGWSLTHQDRLAEAERAFADARVLFDATGSDDSALMCLVQRARILHALDRYQEAAAVNERLIEAYGDAGLPVPQGWAVVREAENHLEGGDPVGAARIAAEWLRANEEAGADLKVVRAGALAVQARALGEMGEQSAADGLAAEALTLTEEDRFDHNTAWMYDIRAQSLLDLGDDQARRVLAHAIALHLAVGSVSRARELSRHFLPQRPQPADARDGGNQPRRDPDAGLGGYL